MKNKIALYKFSYKDTWLRGADKNHVIKNLGIILLVEKPGLAPSPLTILKDFSLNFQVIIMD